MNYQIFCKYSFQPGKLVLFPVLMLEGLFFYYLNYFSKMIPWKDRINTDFENCFWKVWKKYRFSKNSEKKSDNTAEEKLVFYIFWALGSQAKEGRVL